MDPADTLDEETRADAVDVLSDLLHWRLAPQRWERIAESVGSLAAALTDGDVDAVRRAVADLELAGPVRATRIGSVPLTSAPAPLHEQANHLVYALTREQAAEQAAAGGGEADGAGTRTD